MKTGLTPAARAQRKRFELARLRATWLRSGQASPTDEQPSAASEARDVTGVPSAREAELEQQIATLRSQVTSLQGQLRRAQEGRQHDDARVQRIAQLESEAGKLRNQVKELECSIERTRGDRGRLERQVTSLTTEVSLLKGLRTRLDATIAELATARTRAVALQGQLEALETERAKRSGVPQKALAVAPDLFESMTAIARGKGAVLDHLRVAVNLRPDRVVVLDEAWKSASAARDFRYPAKVGDLLHRLLNDYFNDLAAGGKGDAQARAVFGSAFAATESDIVQGNRWMMRHRTFTYDGRQIEALAHLKIGSTDSPHETLRIYFAWDAKARKIVICWCGEHPPNASI